MVQNKIGGIRKEVHVAWVKFWERREVDPKKMQVSTRVLGNFILPTVNEYKHTTSVQAGLNTARQAKALGMVRAKCKS